MLSQWTGHMMTYEDSCSSDDEETILRDKNNPNIYIHQVMKNEVSKTGRLKKHDRVYNSHQYCDVCKVKCSNFSQHISRNAEVHAKEPAIKAINEEKDPNKKKILLTRLRAKFNHSFNMNTIEKGRGLIILERRPTKSFSLEQFGPCPHCFLWILKSLLKKHQKSCCGRDSSVPDVSTLDSIGSLTTQSDSMSGRIPPVANKRLRDETFPKMKNDQISYISKNDTLIVQLGNLWMEKNVGNVLKRGVYTSQIMRLAARFLSNLRKIRPLNETSTESMWDYIEPQYFESLVLAALLTCSPRQDDENNLAAPSNALKLGYDLKRLCNGKIGLCIIKGDKTGEQHATSVLKLMQIYWVTRVTKASRVLLDQRSFDLDKQLPDPDDIITLNNYVNEKIEELSYKETDHVNFKKIAEVIQAKLVMYNRRRSGELQAITLHNYERRQSGQSGVHLVGELSDFEKNLLSSQEVMSIRGKCGRKVPVIIPQELKRGMAYLTNLNTRAAAGVAKSNRFIFASKGECIVWAYDSLKKVCDDAQLKHPQRITSTSLRKYMATMTQVLNLKANEFQWVLNHLGHTMDVHKIHYRATHDILERTQVAKLLMLQDQGRVGEFRNQSLENIQFEDVVSTSMIADEVPVSTDDSSMDELLHQSENLFDDVDDMEEKPKKSRKGRKSEDVRKMWSLEEEEEIKTLLRKFFDSKKRPKPKDCLLAIQRSRKQNGLIQFRKKSVLKKKCIG